MDSSTGMIPNSPATRVLPCAESAVALGLSKIKAQALPLETPMSYKYTLILRETSIICPEKCPEKLIPDLVTSARFLIY